MTRYLATIVVALVITLFTTQTVHAAPDPEPEMEEKKTLREKAKEKADGLRNKTVEKMKGSNSATLNQIGNFIGESVDEECKLMAQEALATFDAAWEQAFDGPGDLLIPGPGQWLSALWIYALVILSAFAALRLCRKKDGKWNFYLIGGVLLVACFALLEVRVTMWGDEIKPQVTQAQADFEQQCPKYKGQIIELATHKTWAARGMEGAEAIGEGAKTAGRWVKSWWTGKYQAAPEEEPEEDLAFLKRWTYGDVRTIAFEENRDPSPFFQWWVGMLIMLAFALFNLKWWKGFWACRKSWRSLLLYVLFWRNPTPPVPSTPPAPANPVVSGDVPVTPPPAPQVQAPQPVQPVIQSAAPSSNPPPSVSNGAADDGTVLVDDFLTELGL